MRRCLILTAAAVLAGCGSDAPRTVSVPARSAGASTVYEGSPSRVVLNQALVRGVRQRLRNAGTQNGRYPTTWYASIEDVGADDGSVTISTSLYPDADADEISDVICRASALHPLPGLDGVTVLAADGGLLRAC